MILTSHSMEECEALCTRLVIMVNGRFRCLGTPLSLKKKYGNGVIIEVRLEDSERLNEFLAYMKLNFSSLSYNKVNDKFIEFIISNKNVKLSEIFKNLEENREIFKIKDYSVNDTTLDQVFVNLAWENEKSTASISSTTNNSEELNNINLDNEVIIKQGNNDKEEKRNFHNFNIIEDLSKSSISANESY